MPAKADVVAYPMAASVAQMHALDAALTHWEGVVDVRVIAAGSARIRAVLLGAEDLAASDRSALL